jgi:hypothetical protein
VKESKPAANPQLDETRKQLLVLLRGGEAHAGFETAIADFPADLRGKVLRQTCTSRFAGARDRTSFAKHCSSPTTPPTISAN